MKRIVLVLFLFSILLVSVFAEINLGNFPVGKWLDSNYDAIWDLSSNNIRITDPSGQQYYDFSTATIKDFNVGASTDGLKLQFYCPETEKTYILIKPLTGTDLILKIQRDNKPDYQVKMKKQ